MAYDSNEKKMDSVYSQRIRAGKRRTYFFDVRETRGNDFYLTITESRKRFNEDGYDRHKIFLYKEDFNKFLKGMTEAIDFVKTELMPDFDFDAFNHDNDQYEGSQAPKKEEPVETPTTESTPPVAEAPAAPETEDTPAAPETESTPAPPPSPPPDTEESSSSSEANMDTSHRDEEAEKW